MDPGDLVEHWTLVGAEQDLLAAEHRDTPLGSALSLTFYGRFPRGRAELHDDVVDFVARRLGADTGSLRRADRWPAAGGRTGPAARAVMAGSGMNVEAKLVMLTFAFEVLVAVRVAPVTDVRHERARAAIEGIGAVREGVLRKHRRRSDGSRRDTVLDALVDDDWPPVKHGPDARPERLSTRIRPEPRPRTRRQRVRTSGHDRWTSSSGHDPRVRPPATGHTPA
jgi:hypothetical protein